MFSKTKPNEAVPQPAVTPTQSSAPLAVEARPPMPAQNLPPKPKPAASVLSSDITITGNVRSSGDIQVEGNVEGDVAPRC